MNISFDKEAHRIWEMSHKYERCLRLMDSKSFLELEDLVEKIAVAEPTIESFEKEMKERLEAVCKELGKTGYKKLWVGVQNPHFDREISGRVLVVEPYEVRPPLLCGFFDIVSRYFPTSAGNGLRNAMMYYLDINLPKNLFGVYELEDYGKKER